jgi:hypothetical protein
MSQRFSHTQYSINGLVEQIDSGDLSLPDLQRPFVWNRRPDTYDDAHRCTVLAWI